MNLCTSFSVVLTEQRFLYGMASLVRERNVLLRPARYEYIQWLSSLLGTSRPASTTSIDAERQIMGIDM